MMWLRFDVNRDKVLQTTEANKLFSEILALQGKAPLSGALSC